MLTTLARTTLLSFRLQPTLTVLLAAAGVFGFIEGTRVAARGRDHAWGRRRAAGGGGDRAGRRDRVQPGHPRRAAARPHHRLHRHRRPRPARRPPSARLGEVLPADRRRDHPGDRQTARPDRGADRRLQLPVLLPLLRLPGADLALRQPARAVRQAGGRDQELGQAQDRRPVHPRAGHTAVGAADGVPDAPRRLAGNRAPTPCGWPRTSTPTSPTSAATRSSSTPPCSPTRGSPSPPSARSCWPSASRTG